MGTAPRVVVTGMGAETALGHGVSSLWEGALLGRTAIRPVTRFDTRRFHATQAALRNGESADDGTGPGIGIPSWTTSISLLTPDSGGVTVDGVQFVRSARQPTGRATMPWTCVLCRCRSTLDPS